MNEQELANNIINDSFEVIFDVNVDIKQNRYYINAQYSKVPKNLHFMCASLLLWTATRILWLAKSTQNYEMIDLYSRLQELSNSMYLCNTPLNNKHVKIFCIGTTDKYNFNLDYEGFAFGGMFAKDIPIITLYSFFALFKYIASELLPIEQNMEFYNGLMQILNELIEYNLENATPIQMRQICMGNAVHLAYAIDEN